MDELLYLLALIAGIVGTLAIWRYARSKQRAAVRVIQKRKQQEGNEKSRDEY
jgi:drug/metabolite transporter superfamily protein YnfA